jgi:hypothetical protein
MRGSKLIAPLTKVPLLTTGIAVVVNAGGDAPLGELDPVLMLILLCCRIAAWRILASRQAMDG